MILVAKIKDHHKNYQSITLNYFMMQPTDFSDLKYFNINYIFSNWLIFSFFTKLFVFGAQ